MINCKNCGFNVENKMKFSLIKNICPACGDSLFSEEDMNHISMISNRVNLQPFSKKLNEGDIYDISLFLFNEIKTGVGGLILKDSLPAPSEEVDGDKQQPTSEPEDADMSAFDFNEIRKEVEQEMLENISMPEDVDEDMDDKAKRLKRIAENSPFKRKTGAVVKRIS